MNNNYQTFTPVVPTNSGTLVQEPQWGVDALLSNFIIQSEDITKEVVTDQTQDQKGRVVSELDYDQHYTCSLGIIGSGTPPTEGSILSFKPDTFDSAVNWKVRSVQFNGAYNEKKKWTVELERFANFPAAD